MAGALIYWSLLLLAISSGCFILLVVTAACEQARLVTFIGCRCRVIGGSCFNLLAVTAACD